jgi:transposase-like protein
MKEFERECPNCGSFNSTVQDVESGYCSTFFDYYCNDCGATWTEQCRHVYDGYKYEDEWYDKEGNKE